MNKYILPLILLVYTSCSVSGNNANFTGKPITQNIPSDDKYKLEGTPLGRSASADVQTVAGTEYTLLQRLYDTVWMQSEFDFDDGRVEYEAEFILFNNKSYYVEREFEDGRMEKVEMDDYKKLELIEELPSPIQSGGSPNQDKNAIIVRTTEFGGDFEREYEGYWLRTPKVLYVVEGDNPLEVKYRLQTVMSNPAAVNRHGEHYVLSTQAQ
ncbi:MAG: hypothetical protein ACRCTQ_01870 [Brevinemataceae bacterium]